MSDIERLASMIRADRMDLAIAYATGRASMAAESAGGYLANATAGQRKAAMVKALNKAAAKLRRLARAVKLADPLTLVEIRR